VSRRRIDLGPDDDAASSAVVALGRRWVDHVVATLHVEGRGATGSWPGTLSEARAVLRPMGGLSDVGPEEQERLVRTLNAVARRLWLSRREPEEADLPVDEP
jgi:hypothetical protein